MPRWLRAVLAMAALITLVVLTNVLPSNPYAWISEQGWRMGRFVHFNSLAQWLGWLWPFLAFCYVMWRFEQVSLTRHERRKAAAARREAGKKEREKEKEVV